MVVVHIISVSRVRFTSSKHGPLNLYTVNPNVIALKKSYCHEVYFLLPFDQYYVGNVTKHSSMTTTLY